MALSTLLHVLKNTSAGTMENLAHGLYYWLGKIHLAAKDLDSRNQIGTRLGGGEGDPAKTMKTLVNMTCKSQFTGWQV